jgi:hypothetical protein
MMPAVGISLSPGVGVALGRSKVVALKGGNGDTLPPNVGAALKRSKVVTLSGDHGVARRGGFRSRP